MKKPIILFITVTILSCNNQDSAEKEITVISNDTIPELRTVVSSKPIADYTQNAGDALNRDWAFTVRVFETSKTFRFVMKIKFEELDVVDTLIIPDLHIQPVVELQPGKEKFSCIAGFKDKAQKFREYKKVSVENNQLKIITLKHYGVYATMK